MTSKRRIDFRLYLITDRNVVMKSRHLLSAVEDALMAGVRAVQLREKDLPTRELLDLAHKMRELTARYGAEFFVNDRADIALCVRADGVHLGQNGMPAYAVRKVAGKGMLIGVSTHSLREAEIAQREGADFITFGPLYPTPSKMKYGAPVGVEALRRLREYISVPVFGIGGIKRDTIREVLDAGAQGVALISGILGETGVKAAAESYIKEIKQGEQL